MKWFKRLNHWNEKAFIEKYFLNSIKIRVCFRFDLVSFEIKEKSESLFTDSEVFNRQDQLFFAEPFKSKSIYIKRLWFKFQFHRNSNSISNFHPSSNRLPTGVLTDLSIRLCFRKAVLLNELRTRLQILPKQLSKLKPRCSSLLLGNSKNLLSNQYLSIGFKWFYKR